MGFNPIDLMTVPSSLDDMLPSSSLSNRVNARLMSADGTNALPTISTYKFEIHVAEMFNVAIGWKLTILFSANKIQNMSVFYAPVSFYCFEWGKKRTKIQGGAL